MRAECFSMRCVQVRPYGLAPGGAGQASIEMPFRSVHGKQRQPRGCRVPFLHFIHCLDRRHVIGGEKARLKLSYPVETLQEGAGSLTSNALLEGALCETTIVEGAELGGFPAQGPSERNWREKAVEEESVPPHELQPILGFALELVERTAQCQKSGAESARGD